MNDYYKELNSISNYKDLLNILVRISSEIDYCTTTWDNDRLNELKQILIQMNIIVNYVIKKKFQIVLPMLVEERKELLSNELNRCIELSDIVSKVYLIDEKRKEDFDELPKLNEWINKVFSLYNEYGYQVKEDEFKNIFDQKAVDYEVDNYLVYEYIKLIFKNKDEYDSYAFTDLIVRLSSDIHYNFSDVEPVIDIMCMAINKFNKKNKGLFKEIYDDFDREMVSFGLNRNMYKKSNQIMNVLNKQMEDVTSKLEELNNGDYSFILSDYEDRFISTDELDIDIEINRICNVITNNKFSKMDSKMKDKFFDDLYDIMDTVVKYNEFNKYREEYNEYSKINKYDSIYGEYVLCIEERRNISSKILELEKKIKLENSKLIFPMLGKKKNYSLEYELSRLKKELNEIDKKIKDVNVTKSKYIYNFVNKYGLYEYGYSVDKLFGVFDFDMLPVDINKVNNMDLFKEYGIVLPEDIRQFSKLYEICYFLMKNSIFVKRINSNLRKLSLASDETLDYIMNKNYESLVATAGIDDVKNSIKKR